GPPRAPQPEEAGKIDAAGGGRRGVEAVGGVDEGGEGSPARGAREEGRDEARPAPGRGATDLGELAPPEAAAAERVHGPDPRGEGPAAAVLAAQGRPVSLQAAQAQQVLEGGLRDGGHISLFLRYRVSEQMGCQARLSLQFSAPAHWRRNGQAEPA